MANATFNAGIDYFGLQAASNPKLKVKSSAENRTKQSASGANCFGDVRVVDSYGETASPSAEYDIVADITHADFPNPLGTVSSTPGIANPVVLGTVTITTSSGANPTATVQGEMVQSGATTLRDYTLPRMKLLFRHRAQDFLCTGTGTTYSPIMSITRTSDSNPASPVNDYGFESVSATFPIEITKAMPKGDVVNYDLHGGTATCNYTMNWYASTESGGATVEDKPIIALTAEAQALGYTISTPVGKTSPEGGYTQYTWTVSLFMVGNEHI